MMRLRAPAISATALAAAGVLATAALLSPATGASAAPPPATPYRITDLGVLPGGTFSIATAVSNSGIVAGYGDATGNSGRAFTWNGSLKALNNLPGGGYSRAHAVNDRGEAAGVATRSSGGYGYPVKWSASGTATDLGGTIVNQLGVANAINNSGLVAGGQRDPGSSGDPVGLVYDPTEPSPLPIGAVAQARGMNERGQVVGGPGYIWQKGKDLVSLPGLLGPTDRATTAYAINIRGQVVGAAGLDNTLRPVLWQGESVRELGMLPGIPYSEAKGINVAGDVVGTADPRCSPCVAPRAWRWRNNALTPLDALLPANSGWTLREANGINDRGQIVGAGLHNGVLRGFLLTPAVHVNVDFAPAGAAVGPGYVADTGAVFGVRANGLTFGWNVDNSAQTRNRNAATSPDERYDTLTHLQKQGGARRWELAVPNGRYLVHAVAGDPSATTDSSFALAVEGVVVVSGKPTADAPWQEGTKEVTVADGRLSITNGLLSSNNKIDYLDVSSI